MISSLAQTPPPSSSASSASFSLDLHAKTEQELDLLPYGVIALDREGTIVRYNRVEARLARLDRALVLGKHFFRKIAPCTATPEFEGRFRTFADDPRGPSRLRFEYVFNFRFGAQEVDVDLVRSSSPEHIYICIGRRAFRRQPVREVPGGALDGIALADLAPDEAKKGVVRDESDRRNLVVDVSFLDALIAAYAREPRGSLEDLGVAYGRRIAIDLEAESGESFDTGLREVPIVTLMEMIARLIRRQGWGALSADLRPARAGVVTFTLERSVLAEAPGALGGKRCAMVGGILRALLSHVAASPMVVRETHCAAEGGGDCTFVATGARREVVLDEAISKTGGSLGHVLGALGDGE
jgi:photoactive yellow protein